ncbi:hypothetical protein LTR95_001543 [Oleoguttula sp. CCFEE 5521]
MPLDDPLTANKTKKLQILEETTARARLRVRVAIVEEEEEMEDFMEEGSAEQAAADGADRSALPAGFVLDDFSIAEDPLAETASRRDPSGGIKGQPGAGIGEELGERVTWAFTISANGWTTD